MVIDRADFDDEHHRILHQRARIELDERIAHRAADDAPGPERFLALARKALKLDSGTFGGSGTFLVRSIV